MSYKLSIIAPLSSNLYVTPQDKSGYVMTHGNEVNVLINCDDKIKVIWLAKQFCSRLDNIMNCAGVLRLIEKMENYPEDDFNDFPHIDIQDSGASLILKSIKHEYFHYELKG